MFIVTIPGPTDKNEFVEVEVRYDVIATAGPPAPPLDTVLTGWSFIDCWRVHPEANFAIEPVDLLRAGKGIPPEYTAWIDEYIGRKYLDIQGECRDFELTLRD